MNKLTHNNLAGYEKGHSYNMLKNDITKIALYKQHNDGIMNMLKFNSYQENTLQSQYLNIII